MTDGTQRNLDEKPYSREEVRIVEALAGIGVEPGSDPIGTLFAEIQALLSFRGAHEAPGWNYKGSFNTGGHLSDAEVAGRVRMLMRDQLDHEAVCVLARDRIRDLSRALGRANARLKDLGQPTEVATPEL